jgi:hypothetical protein
MPNFCYETSQRLRSVDYHVVMANENRRALQERRIGAEERRQRLAELMVAGVRDRNELARALGVSKRTVYRDLVVIQEEFRERSAELVAQERGVSLLRLERYVRELQPDIARADRRVPAIRLLKEIEERRAKLLGLDAPTKTAPTDPSGELEYSGIPEHAMRRMLERGREEARHAPTVEHFPVDEH